MKISKLPLPDHLCERLESNGFQFLDDLREMSKSGTLCSSDELNKIASCISAFDDIRSSFSWPDSVWFSNPPCSGLYSVRLKSTQTKWFIPVLENVIKNQAGVLEIMHHGEMEDVKSLPELEFCGPLC